jgi:glycosyltransferase involved in cell wall biosynthesis
LKISIIIPYFNNIGTIERTLQSVFSQTFKNYEIILINDSSNDDPIDIIEHFSKVFREIKVDLKYVRLEKNSGPSIARNYAWNLASGDYVAFLDGDDFWHPNKLEFCEEYLKKLDPDFLYHNADISLSGKLNDILNIQYTIDQFSVRKIRRSSWLLRNNSVTPATMIKANLPLRFNEKMKFSEDYDLWLRLAFLYNNVYKIDGPPLTFLGKPFMHGNGLSSNINLMRIGEMKLFIKFCFSFPMYFPLLPFLLFYSLCKHIFLLRRKLFSIKSHG